MDEINQILKSIELREELTMKLMECGDAEVLERINTESENNLEEKVKIVKKSNALKELSEEEYKILES